MKDWNPDLYLKFKNERAQPSIDLVSRIHTNYSPTSIIDIGCGPGNSSQVLVERWPDVKVVGLDNSPSMIEKAKQDYPGQEWILADAAQFVADMKFDILFSNATIQWVPDHAELIRKFRDMLSDRGLLAVQIPLFWDMPLGKAIKQVASEARWNKLTTGVSELLTIRNPSFYYNELAKYFNSIEMWVTDYIHVMESHMAILEMISSTGLRPYLDRLENDEKRQSFENDVLAQIKINYPVQENGNVLFPFKRLFFIGSN
ncbi:methyltransferase domain-containing protein [candidate division KSB1 bacterium]|nr:methyltransferase domain-containing protein [candidate division KSB1 bacterium]